MSKYTRLNKINHYHDSGLTNRDSREIRPPIESDLELEQGKVSILPASVVNVTRKNKKMNNKAPSTPSHHNQHEYQHQHHSHYRSRHYTKTNLKLAFFAFISLLLVLLICINEVHSLNCYHCSSVDNPGCDEAFTGKANLTEADTNCEKHIGRPAKVCRKIIQYIEQKKVVIRSCGFIDDHDEKDRKPMCFKRSGTFAIMMESCNCYTDNCNHSASLVPHQSVLILVLVSCSIPLLRCFQPFYYYSLKH